MSVSEKESNVSNRRLAELPAQRDRATSLLSPVDMLVNLLVQPERRRDGVEEDIDAARRRQQRR